MSGGTSVSKMPVWVGSILYEDGSGEKTGRLASTGADVCVRVWEITFHM